MEIEQIEEITCSTCGQINYIKWNEGETERNIPCSGCYWEEWIGEASDPIPDAKKGQVFTKFKQTKVEHGTRFNAIKNSGGKVFNRNAETKQVI